MAQWLDILAPLHKKTARDYLGRMTDDKVHCSQVARRYDRDYWDGSRRYGYGGYNYDGRWKPVAERLIGTYNLLDGARVLDVGCGKAHLLYEISELLPSAAIAGFDVSKYAIENSKPEIRGRLYVARAEDPFSYQDRSFDLVISLMTLHNLVLPDLARALAEIERVGINKYVVVESYRTVEELHNLQCWALTCETFLRPDEWVWLFDRVGYRGDYEFVFFE